MTIEQQTFITTNQDIKSRYGIFAHPRNGQWAYSADSPFHVRKGVELELVKAHLTGYNFDEIKLIPIKIEIEL